MKPWKLFTVLICTSSLLWDSVFCSKFCDNKLHPLTPPPTRNLVESYTQDTHSHNHLIPTDDSEWLNLRQRMGVAEEEDEMDEQNWAMAYRQIKISGVSPAVTGMLNDVSLHDVRVEPNSMHGRAQLTNLEYILMLDVDRLVWNFRQTAGLQTIGQPYAGWENPKLNIRGHFVGHYLSAAALMWASTHNDTVKKNMDYAVAALSQCQQKMGTGYLSAFPSEQFDLLESLQEVWAPYYTIHKIMAGLSDQYTFAGNDQALKMVIWMADYFNQRVLNVIKKYSIDRHWAILNEEFGGMNDLLYQLYSVTGDQKHLALAHLFDKPCFLGMLAVKADDLSEMHANTHIPVVIGSQMRYKLTGDQVYKEMGAYFMDIMNSSHSYATGGTSVGERWTPPMRLADTLGSENEETCTTYNMLKVSRNLFRWTKEMAYADYYERALTNGILSTQRGNEPGIMIYMLPLAPGSSKAISFHKWGSKFDSFWCCYGTALESFAKLGDSIYFEETGSVPSLYIIQYISSTINWRKGNVAITQNVTPVVSWDPRLRVTFTFTTMQLGGSLGEATINFRIPLWATSTTNGDDAKAMLNEQDMPLPAPGSFFSVTRKWNSGDKVTFDIPISLRTEAIKDDRPEFADLKAILYGPYLLAGFTDGDWYINAKSASSFSDWITPIPSEYNSQLISLSQKSSNSSTIVLSNSNGTLTMKNLPLPGTNGSLFSTFRLVITTETVTQANLSVPENAIGQQVMLEPFNFPGMAIVHQGEGNPIQVGRASAANGGSSIFRLVAGLDGNGETVSLEAVDRKGCYIYNEDEDGSRIGLRCIPGKPEDDALKRASSFGLGRGFVEYHPMSFTARGVHRNFVLVPLLSLRDEFYTVYFQMTSS